MRWRTLAVWTAIFLGGLALSQVADASYPASEGQPSSDCPEDQCLPFAPYECVELEFTRPALPDFPDAAQAEWVTTDTGEQVAEARERDNGTGDDEMAAPDVGSDGESATVCLFNVGYLTDSTNRLYDFVPWACLEIYVRFQYRYQVTRYVYRTVEQADGSSKKLLHYSYLDWQYAWTETCVSQVCLCPPDPMDGEK
ncbi:MAG: hypothetical protein AAF368_14240 [Planctomycetota bacterium]